MIRISPALEKTALAAYHLMGVRVLALSVGRDWLLGKSHTQPNGSAFLVVGPEEGLRDFRAYLMNKNPALTLTGSGSLGEGGGDHFIFAKDFESSGLEAAFDVLSKIDHVKYAHRNESFYVFLDGKVWTRLEHNSSGDWESVKRHVEKTLEGKFGYVTIRESTDPNTVILGQWDRAAAGDDREPRGLPAILGQWNRSGPAEEKAEPLKPQSTTPQPGATYDVLLNGKAVTQFIAPLTNSQEALNGYARASLQSMKTPLLDGDIITVARMGAILSTAFGGEKAGFWVTLGDGRSKKVIVPKDAPMKELGYAVDAPDGSVVTYRRLDQTKFSSFRHTDDRGRFKVDNGGIYPAEFKAPRMDREAIIAKAWEACGGKTNHRNDTILIRAEEPSTAFIYGVWTRVGAKK